MAARIRIYTTRACPYCKAAKELLRSKGTAFEEIDVTDNAGLREKLVRMSGGRRTVPQIFADGKSLGGYEDLAAFYEKGGKL